VDTTVIVVIVVLLVLALVAGGVVLARQRRSQRLRDHYGPEYERSLEQTGDRKAAEAELAEREARHRELDIRELEPAERERFGDSWSAIQRSFVDDPARALLDADELVADIMRTRGYPRDADFDRRAEDVSVEHPQVVRHYREARAVRDATADGTVDTEQQRRAVTSYRSLVEALLGHSDSGRHHDDESTGHHRRADGRRDDSPVDRTGDRHLDDPRRPGPDHNGARPTDTPRPTEEQTR